MNSNAPQIEAAEKSINRILAQLEAATGTIVSELELRDIDVTTYDSDQSWLRGVAITLKRRPGTRWVE